MSLTVWISLELMTQKTICETHGRSITLECPIQTLLYVWFMVVFAYMFKHFIIYFVLIYKIF